MKRRYLLTALSLLLFTMANAQNEAFAKVKSSGDAWIKKYTSFTSVKDTTLTLDSTESAELILKFEKEREYVAAVILSGEVSVSLQCDDGGVGAEIYAAGIKDPTGNSIAESSLKITDDAELILKTITIGGGPGMPCRYIILKKK